jgi:hypothetical protein
MVYQGCTPEITELLFLQSRAFRPHAMLRISAACLERFSNYCGLIKIARSGFLWEKTTKRAVAFPDFLPHCTRQGRECAFP